MEGIKIICLNKKARHEYAIEDTFEAGLVLIGTEVKALREGKANLVDSFAEFERGEAWLYNCHISHYTAAHQFNHNPTRKRKLLLHKQEIHRLIGKTGAVFNTGGSGGAGGAELTMLGMLANLAENGMILVTHPRNATGFKPDGMHWGPTCSTGKKSICCSASQY